MFLYSFIYSCELTERCTSLPFMHKRWATERLCTPKLSILSMSGNKITNEIIHTFSCAAAVLQFPRTCTALRCPAIQLNKQHACTNQLWCRLYVRLCNELLFSIGRCHEILWSRCLLLGECRATLSPCNTCNEFGSTQLRELGLAPMLHAVQADIA